MPTMVDQKSKKKSSASDRKVGKAKSVRKCLSNSSSSSEMNAWALGTKIEVKIGRDDFIGSWYEATITGHVMQSGQLFGYSIEYLSLVKEDDHAIHETDEVSLQDVRPEAPRTLRTRTDNENEDQRPEFEMHDLVEVYHNNGWWYGVISCLKSQATGKYTVSLPIARKILDFSPAEIRPQFDFINGSFVPRQQKTQQEEEIYKYGDEVEARLNREKYGLSWYPAKVEKRIGDHYFLITYENKTYLPNGHETNILHYHFLRPLTDRNTGKIAVNSDVEFFHEGAWSPGVVTSVDLPRGVYVSKTGKGTDVVSELVREDFVRLRLTWDWEKRTFSKPAKRRSLESSKNCLAKKKRKTDFSKSGTVKQKALNGNRTSDEDNSKDPCKSRGDIIKDKMVNSSLQNSSTGEHKPTPSPEQPLSESTTTQAELTPSSSVSANIILPFEGRSPLWKYVDAMPIFKLIPQKPHFMDLDKNKMRDGTALGLAVNFADIADSIAEFSLNDDVSAYEEKLSDLDTLETHGFNVDPLRTRLNKLLAVKQEIREMVSRTEDNNSVQAEVVKIDADLAEVKKKMSKLRKERKRLRVLSEKCLETSVTNVDFISRITHEICSIRRDEEAAQERFSTILREFYGK